MTRSALTRKKATHERIVEAALRPFRRSGYANTGAVNATKDADLTHGGFYMHFSSREAMLAEVADRAGAKVVAVSASLAASAPPGRALASLACACLSQGHIERAEMWCPGATLGLEMPRQAPEIRLAATRHFKAMIDLVARQSLDWGQSEAHERALVTIANDGRDTASSACSRRLKAFRLVARSDNGAPNADRLVIPPARMRAHPSILCTKRNMMSKII